MKSRITLDNAPDPGRIMAALAECWRITMEKRTGKRYIVTVVENEPEERKAVPGVRAS